MTPRIVPFLVAGVVLGAGGIALFRGEDTRAEVATRPASATSPQPETADSPALPPNHPPIGAAGSPHGTIRPSSDEPPALTWDVPRGWQTAPNPNAMRLATYRPSAEAGNEAEITVARAGGTADANIERWLGQFDSAGLEKRTQMKVHGLDVSVVEVTGTYLGGAMMPGAASASHPGWTLVGAIVPTAGSAYFFKLVGPAAQVKAARASFDQLVGSVAPR
jgi:hypothetical protein